MLKSCSALTIALLLSACGGGGSDAGSSGATPSTTTPTTTPTDTSPAVTFNPPKLNATFVAGTAQELNVVATVTRPSDFASATNVYALIVDDTGVIQPNAQVTATSSTQYSARLITQTGLTAGTKTGNFSLRLCKDSACTSQFPGSPVALPYELVVTPKS